MSVPSITGFRCCSLCGVRKPHTSEFFVLSNGYVSSKCRSCNKFDQHARYMGLPLVKARKPQPTEKKCTTCYQVKPLDSFHLRVAGDPFGGRAAVCKPCRSKARRKPAPLKNRVPEGTKYCPGCSQAKFPEAFSKRQKSSDGLAIYCKECATGRRRRYREQKQEHVTALERASNKRNREAKLLRDRAYHAANKERMNAASRSRYWADPERYREQMRAYGKANPEKVLQHSRNRRARELNAEGTHTAAEVWQMLEDQDHLCAYCETPLFGMFQVDHMTPLIRGGSNDWSNLAIACAFCNNSKNARTVEEYVEWLKRNGGL